MVQYEREIERLRKETRVKRHQAQVQRHILHDLQTDFVQKIFEPLYGLMQTKI